MLRLPRILVTSRCVLSQSAAPATQSAHDLCVCCLGVCDLCMCRLGVCCLCVCCLGVWSLYVLSWCGGNMISTLLTSNLGLVGHTRQFQKPMSSGLIQHWHFLLRPMSSGHNHDIHRNMYEVFKEAAPAKTHSRTLCHHCVTRVPGSGI